MSEDLETALEALEDSAGGAGASLGALEGELRAVRGSAEAAGQGVSVLSGGISRELRRAFDGVISDGARLSDVLRDVARSMVDAAYNAALAPVTSAIGGAASGAIESAVGALMPFAKGGSFAQGRVMPFATGGIVTGPVTFPMRGGTGLMGEAGPEAIMPLARGADGKLGVRAPGGGAGPVQVVVNVSTPDAEGFRRSRGQIAAEMSRALARGRRNL
ncbi:phage tail tape measure protein [Palleronia sediminis]|uniref:Phage tail tape measure protein n=1 Tax=Palleronia sediminis TaxID=2547833 RepID=A0A4R6AB60_9RHOB|nr:phage tail tape measure protein [Palleronia sediminis]TDL79558.1 phage tail tape measure protein [Palleronia sediminis]